jgi:hypothetical protein
MEKPILNFEIFELPFFNEVKDKLNHNISKEDIEEEEDNDIVKENMESRVPESAIYLGAAETEAEHMTAAWMTLDDYYIYPLQNDAYNWAVFRISWDDNWGQWNWRPDGRIKGLEANYKEAAKLILYELWKQWGIDINDSENISYLNILEQI